ncbi:MAG: DedA family protein [Candidatus Binataceae bacterium]
MYSFLSLIAGFILALISTLGYGGIILLMAAESACLPVPSESVLPFAGYLVATGRFNLQLVALTAAFGCLLGSYVAYAVGATGGRWVLERYGRYVLISPHELKTADRFFDRWGSPAIFIARLLPVVRTFIAFPAGVSRMRILPFTIYTFIGSWIWCFAMAYVGMKFGQHWQQVEPYVRRFDDIIVAVILVALAYLIYTRVRTVMNARTIANDVENSREIGK